MPIQRHATSDRSVGGGVSVVKSILAAVLVVTVVGCRGPETGEVAPPKGSTGVGESIRIAAAGDLCEAGDPVSGCAATADLVEHEEPDVVLVLGDAQYEKGDESDFEEFYDPNWGRFKDITLPAPGNHDKFGRSGYDEYFEKPQHYVSDLGDWRVLSLDSNDVEGGEEFAQNELPSSDTELVFWHHARYSSGTDHGSTSAVDPLWDAARDGGACVVLYAHDHVYERGEKEDVAWFLVGTGGGEQHDDFIEREPVEGSEEAIGQELGVLFMILKPGARYSFEFKSADGDVLDSGSGECPS
jgi:acid phosphatase type 7